MNDQDEAEERLGTRLGNYHLRSILGRGGMGVVYRAEHAYIGKSFAVKILHRRQLARPEARARLLEEARAAGVIEHPNLVGVTDFGEAPDGTIFLVMKYVEGTSLSVVLQEEGRIGLFRALSILGQMTRGLAAAHDVGVVHRDLKPQNVMLQQRQGRRLLVRDVLAEDGPIELVEPEGPYDFVTVLDFGAAQLLDPTADPSDEVLGTPSYMAPETIRTGAADARADIYSAGVIFYEMLTGSAPFRGSTTEEILHSHVQAKVEPPLSRNAAAEITPEAEGLLMRMLEKDPARRPQTMLEVHVELQRCYGKVRFRRSAGDFPGRPLPLTQVKRRGEVTETAVSDRPAGSTPPVLLTRRKPERTPTLPFGPGADDGASGSDGPKKGRA